MNIGTISILLLTAATFAGAASAQDTYVPSTPAIVDQGYVASNTTPAEPPWSGDNRGMADLYAGKPIEVAFDALKVGNFIQAEGIFADFMQRNPHNGEGALYLGATRMELGKWTDAKAALEVAVRRIPRHPDPKSRLGVTFAKLGDIGGANTQRAELVKMAAACNNSCRLSAYINSGIRMIDDALAQPAVQD